MLIKRGIVHGIFKKDVANRETGELMKTEYFLGIQHQYKDKYGQTTSDVTDVKFTNNQISKGLHREFEQLKGKNIDVEVFINTRSWNDKVFTTMYLASDQIPAKLD